MPMFSVSKDPQADLDYSIDWTAWLGTDTISTSTWSVDSSTGITLHDDSVATEKIATVWMRGGNPRNTPYTVTNHITTAAGRADDRSIQVLIVQR